MRIKDLVDSAASAMMIVCLSAIALGVAAFFFAAAYRLATDPIMLRPDRIIYEAKP